MSTSKLFFAAVSAPGKAIHALWTCPSILFASFMIGWGAEAAQYFMSQGLALAILALLQTLPEFAVEAALAWKQDTHLMLANLTGSLRLLMGLGWPMIYFVRAAFRKGKTLSERLTPLELEKENSIEVMALFLPLVYFLFIYLKGSLYFYDGLVLLTFYILYLWIIRKVPPAETEEASEMPYVARKIVVLPPLFRNLAIIVLFVAGGAILYFAVEPFLSSLMALATTLGISQFVFIQWVSPFLSEFPEKLTAFNWARQDRKAPMALMNMVNSNINQWTLMVTMMILIFCYSKGEWTGLEFDSHQKTELALTLCQSLLGFLILLNLKFSVLEAAYLFVLWLAQFLIADLREEITWLYLALSAGYVLRLLLKKERAQAVFDFADCWRRLVRKNSV